MRTKRNLALAALILGIAAAGFLTGCDDDECPTSVCYKGPPPVPAGVYTVTGDGSVQVYWSPIRGAEVRRYGVYRSLTPEGSYQWIADVSPSDAPYYVDAGLVNGTTYYYAVDAQYSYGESELSFETVADTPRPDGTGLIVYDDESDPDRAGLDLSRVEARGMGSDMIRPWNDPLVDYYVIVLDGLFRLVPTEIAEGPETYWNDIQDFGYTDHMDEINFAPLDGWSLDPYGVELIEGHTYVLWTWDDHFAKLRVSAIGADSVVLEWAYQLSADDWERRQLAPRFAGAAKAPRA
ncbi:MAG: fibronectin type III domain-containing protein [Candidatus Eisenbacteria bacterium]